MSDKLTNLIWNLEKQFYSGIATCNTCSKPDCDLTVRGAGLCKHHLTEAIAEETGDRPGVAALVQLLGHRQCCTERVDAQIKKLGVVK